MFAFGVEKGRSGNSRFVTVGRSFVCPGDFCGNTLNFIPWFRVVNSESTGSISGSVYEGGGIEGEAFAKRCEQELGYQPVTVLRRVSAFDLEFTPRLDSLQIDSMDPLDP